MCPEEIKIHQEKCCIRHGCFIESKDCPVILMEAVSEYACRQCKTEGLPSPEEQFAQQAQALSLNQYIEKLIVDLSAAVNKKKKYEVLLLQQAIIDARLQRIEQLLLEWR